MGVCARTYMFVSLVSALEISFCLHRHLIFFFVLFTSTSRLYRITTKMTHEYPCSHTHAHIRAQNFGTSNAFPLNDISVGGLSRYCLLPIDDVSLLLAVW